MTPEQAELKALGFEVPDSVTPIVACRSWRLNNRGDLASHNGTLWTPGKAMKAECSVSISKTPAYHERIIRRYPTEKQLNHEDIPMRYCSCGIYAAKHEEADHIVPCLPIYVHGEVYLWGKIFEGPNGYRAEFAYPKRFFVINNKQRKIVENLGFGVPVIVTEGNGFGFPFPVGNRTAPQKIRHKVSRWYSVPMLPAIPVIGLGVVDALTLDLSRAFNQVLVALVFFIGLVTAVLGAYILYLRRKMKKMMGVSNINWKVGKWK